MGVTVCGSMVGRRSTLRTGVGRLEVLYPAELVYSRSQFSKITHPNAWWPMFGSLVFAFCKSRLGVGTLYGTKTSQDARVALRVTLAQSGPSAPLCGAGNGTSGVALTLLSSPLSSRELRFPALYA